MLRQLKLNEKFKNLVNNGDFKLLIKYNIYNRLIYLVEDY